MIFEFTDSYKYNATEIKIKDLRVTDISGAELLEGRDYKITKYINNIDAGTATAVVSGVGSYVGEKIISFKIEPLTNVIVKYDTAAKTVESVKKSLTITGIDTLIENKDFEIKESKNTSNIILTIKGKGNYSFEKKIYLPNPSSKSKKSSASSKQTKLSTVKGLKIKKKGKKLILTWMKVKNATGYEIIRSKKKNKKYSHLAYTKKKTYTYKKTKLEIKKGTKYYYKVRAFKGKKGSRSYGKFSVAKRK